MAGPDADRPPSTAESASLEPRPSTFPHDRLRPTNRALHMGPVAAQIPHPHTTFTVATMGDETTPSGTDMPSKQWRAALRVAAGAIEDADADFDATVDDVRLFYEGGRIQYELLSDGRSGAIEGRTAAELFVSASALQRDGAFDPAPTTVLVDGPAETSVFVPAAVNRPQREAGAKAAVAIQSQAQAQHATPVVAVTTTPTGALKCRHCKRVLGNMGALANHEASCPKRTDGTTGALKCRHCKRVLGNMGALANHEASCPKRTENYDDSDDSDDSNDSDDAPQNPPPPPPVGAPVWVRRALEHTLLETGVARLRAAIGGGDESGRLDPVGLYASPEVRVGVGDEGVVTLTFVDGSKSRDVPVASCGSYDATLARISQTIRSEVYVSVESVVVAAQADGFQTLAFEGLVYDPDAFLLSWGVQPPPVGTEVELESNDHRSGWEPEPFIVAKVRGSSFCVRECDEWVHAHQYGRIWRYPSKPTTAKRARDAVADTSELLGALFGQERALDDQIPFVGGTIVIHRTSARAGTTVNARIVDESGEELCAKVQCTRGDVENMLAQALNPPKQHPARSPKDGKAVVATTVPTEPPADALLAEADRVITAIDETTAALRREGVRASRGKLLKQLLKRLDVHDLDDADLEKEIAAGMRAISDQARETGTSDTRVHRLRCARDAYTAARHDLEGLVAEFGSQPGPSASSADASPSVAKKARLRR